MEEKQRYGPVKGTLPDQPSEEKWCSFLKEDSAPRSLEKDSGFITVKGRYEKKQTRMG